MPIELRDHLPNLTRELTRLLSEVGESDLATSVADLLILDRCRCGADFCASIYTEPIPIALTALP